MARQRKARRKYHIKNDAFIRYVVSSLKATPEHEKRENLDNYERAAIANPTQWARDATIPEIMSVMNKLGFEMMFVGLDRRNPLKAFEINKGTREFYRRKNVNALLEIAANHRFFCLGGSIVMKSLGLYSQLLNGTLYVPNKDYGTFLQIGKSLEVAATEQLDNVDAVVRNLLVLNGFDELNLDDLAVLFLIRANDSMPMSVRAIYDTLEYSRSYEQIRRRLIKLVKGKYLCKYGIKNNSMYSLTPKGWGMLNKARKAIFENTKFWQTHIKENLIDNGTSENTESRKKAIA